MGMGNPLVLSAASSIANTKEGQNAIGQGINAVKVAVLIFGIYSGAKFLNKKYKKLRADNFAKENAGNPNLTAAAIIYESFTRIGFEESSFLSYLLPSIDISTDEAALYKIAKKVTNIKAVSQAYYILFDRNLFTDTRKGLDTSELQTFWSIINSPSLAENTKTLFPIDSILYSASKTNIIINMAKQVNGKWKGTSELYGTYNFREELGKVIAHGVFTRTDGTKENYYIIKGWFDHGVVLQHQVTNEKI